MPGVEQRLHRPHHSARLLAEQSQLEYITRGRYQHRIPFTTMMPMPMETCVRCANDAAAANHTRTNTRTHAHALADGSPYPPHWGEFTHQLRPCTRTRSVWEKINAVGCQRGFTHTHTHHHHHFVGKHSRHEHMNSLNRVYVCRFGFQMFCFFCSFLLIMRQH